MKNILLLCFLLFILSGCSNRTLSNAYLNNTKFTMPNRNIEYVQDNSEEPQQKEEVQAPRQTDNKNKKFIRVTYTPLTQKECMSLQSTLGLKYCPYDNDHLAGVAKACGGLNNIPSEKVLHELAKKVYNTGTSDTSIYGDRNDEMLKSLGIYEEDSHIFYWTSTEVKDGKRTVVRMFAAKGSIPYFAPRSGEGYTSQSLGNINYGESKYIRTRDPNHDSNIVGLPNEDVLMAICYK